MPSTGDFVIDRLRTAGVRDVFGVPGDYILKFYDKLQKSGIRVIGCTSEMNAGYAADAYARINGIGCVVATYCVGGFSLLNSIACAYAEKSPLLFISGSPGVKERQQDLWLHHMVRTFECQHEVFSHVTCANTVLRNANQAAYEIDRVLGAIKHYKQPGYIELPRDMVDVPITYDSWSIGTPPATAVGDEINLHEALNEATEWINGAKKPVILAGVEVARYGFSKQLIKFAEATNIPVATTLLGKGVVNERHPLSLGVFCGGLSAPEVEEALNESDCIIMLGVLMTDVHFGFMPSKVLRRNVILSTCADMNIRNHSFKKVGFSDFFIGLTKAKIEKRQPPVKQVIEERAYRAQPNQKLRTERLFEKIDSIITEEMAIIADIGDSLFGAAALTTNSNHFLSPAFYTTMGTSIPSALGAQIANKNLRPIVIVGDGAFPMCCGELATIYRLGLNPIVVVLNNKGYLSERFFQDGPYNDILELNYHEYPKVLGGGSGMKATTEEELDEAFLRALNSDKLFIINAVVDTWAATPGLKRMMGSLAKKVGFK